MNASPIRALASLTIVLAAMLPMALHATSDSPDPTSVATATVLEINGAIGHAMSRYIVRGIAAAQTGRSGLVILRIDTPGGLDTAMRDIIRAILASSVPVVSYVSPPGARAASAGTYILYASHVAAMAPATNLGAATPVSIGGESAPSSSPSADRKALAGDQQQQQSGSAMEHKVVNDAVAYIRGLAELRGRNADWAEQAVRGAASLSASAALQLKVVDVIAQDLPDLLRQIDGRAVQMGADSRKLATRDLGIVVSKPDWRIRFLSLITNPTIAYGLLLIGIYGLLFEGYNPGAVFPGVAGAVSLLVALFAFQILSVNYAGLALVAVGIGMISAEFFFPAFGSLGLGGVIAFVVGSLILFDTDIPGMNIGLPVIAAVATVGALMVAAMGWLASRSLRRPVVTGIQAMVGSTAEVFEDFSGRGRVRYGGELWNAHGGNPMRMGQVVRIMKVDGLTLWVEPV
jgi:membrane-bound serine protease (ClpP class)